MLFSAIKLTPEQSHPEHERDENAKTRIDQRWRPYIRIETSAYKQPPSEQAATMPITAQSIQDGKNEPIILICGPIYIFTFVVSSEFGPLISLRSMEP